MENNPGTLVITETWQRNEGLVAMYHNAMKIKDITFHYVLLSVTS